MARIGLILATLLLCCLGATTQAQVEALGISGVGAYWDAQNNVTVGAWGGANVYLLQDSALSVFNRTIYMWANENGPDDVSQSVETYLMTKKYIYEGWFFTLGGGASVVVEDQEDHTNFGLIGEAGYTMYGFDAFAGLKFSSLPDGKHKFLYFGIGLE